MDTEWVFINGSYVCAHQHGSGARSGEARVIGCLRGGTTTKIHLTVDANKHPVDFEVTGGEVHDGQIAPQLIERGQIAPQLIERVGDAGFLIADKGYDSEAIREIARNHNMQPVIPRKSNSTKENPEFDRYLYRLRHLVENAFARICSLETF